MSHPSSTTPLKIPTPTSLSSTTPALPPLTTQLLVSHLRSQTTTIPDLQSLLSDSLARTGWTDRVKALTLELLKSGKCESFPEVFEEVLRRARVPRGDLSSDGGKGEGGDGDSERGPRSKTGGKTIPGQSAKVQKEREREREREREDREKDGTTTPTNAAANVGGAAMNGNGAIAVREGWFGPDGLPDVKIPVATVLAASEFLEERVKEVIEVVDDD